MKAKRVVGIFIILSIFVCMFLSVVVAVGFLKALLAFASAVGVTLIVSFAAKLIYEE